MLPPPIQQRAQPTLEVIPGDCREVMPTLPASSFDAVITDPIYPGAIKAYGKIGEAEWLDMMKLVVTQSRRVLKPKGSAVFILQPNSEKVGKMRPWLWDFLAWACREWNMVQDVWWWNFTSPPTVHSRQSYGLMRPSMKLCVWLGDADCYRNQDAVLLDESESNRAKRLHSRFRVGRENRPSRQSFNDGNALGTAAIRGGVTPFNVLPIPNSNSVSSGGALGQAASTPAILCEWWLRYIVPPRVEIDPSMTGVATKKEDEDAWVSNLYKNMNKRILDPFAGSGTMLAQAHKLGVDSLGIERFEPYLKLMQERFSEQCQVYA